MDTWTSTQIQKLPQSLINYLGSPLFAEEMNTLFEKYELGAEERKDLQDEIFLYILGATHPLDFPAYVQLYGGLSNAQTDEFVEDIHTYLIDPIGEELVEYWMSEIQETDRTSIPVPTPDAPTAAVSDKYNEPVGDQIRAPGTPSKTSFTSPKRKTITDQDLEKARQALKDPYRELPE